jgi:CHAT domain-containing protein
MLVQPLASRIADKTKWVIIPDGKLHQIPFEALLTETVPPPSAADYRTLPYLIKQHEISYHYSATLFLKSLMEPARASYANLFVGFAPVFSETAKNGALFQLQLPEFTVARPDAHRYLVTRDGKTLEELKYSAQELRDILAVFLNHGRNFLYQEASEENFKKTVKGSKYVHVATHGFINSENPKLSNLAFSQPQDNTAKEDGILFSGETYNLDLNADLLVLSACQTGVGKLVKGEGLMALTRGFLYSGARNIIASLWKVYDQHTSLLMVEMYRQIAAGKSYSAALREAKLKMIANPETAGPQSWAGFVLIGR